QSGGAPVAGVAVTFTAPGSGASATFPGGAASVVVTSDAQGLATAPALTAGSLLGSYVVTAAAADGSTTFNLSNIPGTPGNVQFNLAPSSPSEGQSVTLSAGTFSDTDPLAAHTVSVDWGDGSTPSSARLGSGVTSFGPFTHPYADSGNYPVTAQVSD